MSHGGRLLYKDSNVYGLRVRFRAESTEQSRKEDEAKMRAKGKKRQAQKSERATKRRSERARKRKSEKARGENSANGYDAIGPNKHGSGTEFSGRKG
jgi:hypothetical protein